MPVRLPPGATLDPAVAEEIAADRTRLEASFEYWKAQFSDRAENPFDAQDSAAIRLAQAMPYEKYSVLLPSRSHLFDESRSTNRGGDADVLVDIAGCLVSAAELNEEISGSATAITIWDDLKALASEATQASRAPDIKKIARAILFCRELNDLSRRLFFCRQNSGEFSIPVSECLAMFLQEGALFVTPPEDSFEHAPLVKTFGAFSIEKRQPSTPKKPRGCRSERTFLSDKKFRRPGCSSVYELRGFTTVRRSRAESLKLDAFWRTLIVNGGLDSISNPQLQSERDRLARRAKRDELMQFYDLVRKNRKTVRAAGELEKLRKRMTTLRDGVGFSQRDVFDDVVIGLLMCELDTQENLQSVDRIFDNIRAEVMAHFDAHEVRVVRRGIRRFAHVLSDRNGTDVYRCLRVQIRWYSSRANWVTLVPRSERGRIKKHSRISPFVAYLRFHSGDAIFVGILLRTVVNLEKIVTYWKANKAVVGDRLTKLMAGNKWISTGGADRAQLKRDLERHWMKKVDTEAAWRHIGLIDELKTGNPKTVPPWLAKFKPRRGRSVEITAGAIATRLMLAVDKYGLHEILEVALEFTPVDVLRKSGALVLAPRRKVADIDPAFMPGAPDASRIRALRRVESRKTVGKAHNFERIRLVYEAAFAKARVRDKL
ncbi:MAG: hypothetical protein AAFX56_10575 [Pseudomonadota bacterium]